MDKTLVPGSTSNTAQAILQTSATGFLSGLLNTHHDLRPGKTGRITLPLQITKLLIVESNGFLQELLEVTFSSLMGRQNLRLSRAYTGRMGLRLILQEQPQIVIFDLHMPMMSGLEMLQQLQETELWVRGYRPHLIALTSQTQPKYIEQTLELGVDNYYTKPFNPQALLEKIQDLINNKLGEGQN